MLVLHRGEVIFREAFGVADVASGRPFTTSFSVAGTSVRPWGYAMK